MTVAAKPATVTYIEDGASVSFPVPFRFKAAADLIVERLLSAGGVQRLVIGTDYRVTGGATDAGGTLTRTIAAGGGRLRIRRRTARAQPMTYATGDRFPAASHEEAIDRGILIAQEQDADADDLRGRALLVPSGQIAPTFPALSGMAGKVLGVNASGQDIIPVTALDNGGLDTLATLADPAAGADTVAYDARQTVRGKLDRMVFATDARFAGGAVGNGIVDDRPALQAAIDWLAARGGGTLVIPVGIYRMMWALAPGGGICCLVLKDGVSIVGENRFASVLRVSTALGFGAGTYFRGICTEGRINKVLLSNFCFDGNRDGQGVFRDAGNGGNIVIDASDCIVDGVRSIEANGQGIQVRGGPTNPIEIVSITDCFVAGCSGSTIAQDGTVLAEFNGNGIGIQVGYAKDLRITGNTVRSCKDNAIDTYAESGSFDAVGGGLLISGNILRSCRVGVFPETSSRASITGNKIEDMAEAGIALNRINSAPSEVVVEGNTIRTTLVGIRVSGNMESLNIEDNFISNITAVSGGCIGLYTASGFFIKGNTFKPNNPDIPLIRTGDAQAVFGAIGENYFYGTPNTDRMIVRGAADHTGFNVFGPFLPINNGGFTPVGEGGTFTRNNGRLLSLSVGGPVGFNGASPTGKIAAAADATDAASTQALVNSLKAALRTVGIVA